MSGGQSLILDYMNKTSVKYDMARVIVHSFESSP